MSTRIFLTGASGFVGTILARRLCEQGYEVFGVYHSGCHPKIDDVHWIKLNLFDEDAVVTSIGMIQPDVLMHFAWVTSPVDYENHQLNMSWLNLSEVLLSQFIAQGGSYFVGVGSCAEYDWCDKSRFMEECSSLSSGVFGSTKNAFRMLSQELCKNAGISYLWLRPFFIYGPNEPLRKLVSSIIHAVINNKKFVCKNGNAIRDYIYIDDLVDSIIYLANEKVEGCVNLGTGRGIRIKDIAQCIEQSIGGQTTVEVLNGHDESRVVADVERLQQFVRVSSFKTIEDGIKKMYLEAF